MGGADQGEIHRHAAAGAQRSDLFLLQDAQEAGLQRQRHIADLKKQHPAVSLADFTDIAIFAGAGKRPRLVAEELGFDQRFRNGGAVNGDKFTAAPAAVPVQRAADILFTAAGFSFNAQGDAGVEQPQQLFAFARTGKGDAWPAGRLPPPGGGWAPAGDNGSGPAAWSAAAGR